MLWKFAIFAFILKFSDCQEAEPLIASDVTDASLCAGAQRDCDICIQAHQNCIWCLDPDKTGKRCQLVTDFCNNTESPTSHDELVEDKDFTIAGDDYFDNIDEDGIREVIQLKPQKLKVKLRKNDPHKFNITFKKVIDYPLDLYYVMDLSFSMKDDLEKLQLIGANLVEQIRQNITENAFFGFGTFVDKPVMPYVSTLEEKLRSPCSDCSPPFGFRHQLNISFPGNDSASNAFSDAVLSTNISGNIDIPEGGFDALMQIAVCKEQIGWRDLATRMVLFASDAPPHMANDGKLAGILRINDMLCHLEKAEHVNTYLDPNELVYSRSKYDDYPSVGQLKKVFLDNKIQVIFAVTNDVIDLYKDLETVVNNINVRELSNDSSNILELVEQAYSVLRGKLNLNIPTPPEGVEMKFRYLCPNASDWLENTPNIECNNITEGVHVIYEFELTSTGCPEGNTTHSMKIDSGSLQDEVEVIIEYVCECDCKSQSVSNSSDCNTAGEFTCGTCYCNSGKTGKKCQCDAQKSDGTDVNDSCKKPGSNLYCESKGECDCGTCSTCQDGYQDTYCHCRSVGCPVDQSNKMCGYGTCENCDNNPKCICDPGWTENSLGVCTCSDTLCTSSSGVVCNNQGTCACGRCQCNESYAGEMCTQCEDPRCVDIDATCGGDDVLACVECIAKQDKRGESEGSCSSECKSGLRFKLLSALYTCGSCDSMEGSSINECYLDCEKHLLSPHFKKQSCTQETADDCTTYFDIYWVNSYEYIIYVKDFLQDSDCKKPIPLIYIIAPTVAAVFLFGLIGLVAWKLVLNALDKREYEKFVEEKKAQKWNQSENPLWKRPEETFKNPAFNAIEDDE